MHNSYKRLCTYVFAAVFVIGLAGCDNPLSEEGSDSGDAPNVPEIQQRNVDVSHFQENYPAGQNDSNSEDYSNFNSAAPIALAGGSVINAGTSLAGSFLSLARSEGASEDDGNWVWEYSQSYEGESVSIRLIAESTDDGIYWQMILNSDTEDGENFDDYLFMEGTVSEDGDDGTWRLYDYQPDQDPRPSYVYEWEIQSETERMLDVTTYDEEGNWDTRIDYDRNAAEHTMVFEENNDEPTSEIFWDTDAGTGYFMEGDEQMCWNADFQNVPCN